MFVQSSILRLEELMPILKKFETEISMILVSSFSQNTILQIQNRLFSPDQTSFALFFFHQQLTHHKCKIWKEIQPSFILF